VLVVRCADLTILLARKEGIWHHLLSNMVAPLLVDSVSPFSEGNVSVEICASMLTLCHQMEVHLIIWDITVVWDFLNPVNLVLPFKEENVNTVKVAALLMLLLMADFFLPVSNNNVLAASLALPS